MLKAKDAFKSNFKWNDFALKHFYSTEKAELKSYQCLTCKVVPEFCQSMTRLFFPSNFLKVLFGASKNGRIKINRINYERTPHKYTLINLACGAESCRCTWVGKRWVICSSQVCQWMFVRQIFVSAIWCRAFHSKQFFFPFHQKTTFSFSSNVQKGFGQSLFVCRLTKCHWCPVASIIKLGL